MKVKFARKRARAPGASVVSEECGPGLPVGFLHILPRRVLGDPFCSGDLDLVACQVVDLLSLPTTSIADLEQLGPDLWVWSCLVNISD